jgi:hypothetical protein
MRKAALSLLLFCLTLIVNAQEGKESPFKSQIKSVTVFLSGAQVFESAIGNFPAGESVVVIKGLSPYLDEKSIQVKGRGNFVIQAVNRRLDYLSEKGSEEEVKKLEEQLDAIGRNQSLELGRLEILGEKSSLLNANKNLGGRQSTTSIANLKQALDFYDAELTTIKKEELQIKANLQEENIKLNSLRNQLASLQASENKSTSEIRIKIKAPVAGSASFDMNYLVANASWYPKYDIRVKDVNSPLSINYKAEVNQNTGVDWKNVKLRFSNGTPNQGGQAPDLDKWELNYARLTVIQPRSAVPISGNVSGRVIDEQGEGIPGATVLVKGTTIGTNTDLNGGYSITVPTRSNRLVFSFIGMSTEERTINSSSINVQLLENSDMLSEVVVQSFGDSQKRSLEGRLAGVQIRGDNSARAPEAQIIQTTFQENQTTVEIEVDEPYTIKTNGERMLIDLKVYEIPAVYQYSAIPKLEKDAFLLAQISDWSKYSLLEGESNLYFEDGFVGKSILDATSLQDTLAISMGRDRSIVIERKKNEEFSQKRFIGSNITESRQYEILIRNNKSQPVSIKVTDQIPISVNSDIQVEAKELFGGTLNPQTGLIEWEVKLQPGEQKALKFGYEVKYPKREKVILD